MKIHFTAALIPLLLSVDACSASANVGGAADQDAMDPAGASANDALNDKSAGPGRRRLARWQSGSSSFSSTPRQPRVNTGIFTLNGSNIPTEAIFGGDSMLPYTDGGMDGMGDATPGIPSGAGGSMYDTTPTGIGNDGHLRKRKVAEAVSIEEKKSDHQRKAARANASAKASGKKIRHGRKLPAICSDDPSDSLPPCDLVIGPAPEDVILSFLLAQTAESTVNVRGCSFRFVEASTIPVVIDSHRDPTKIMECIGGICNYDYKLDATIQVASTMINQAPGFVDTEYEFIMDCPQGSTGMTGEPARASGGSQPEIIFDGGSGPAPAAGFGLPCDDIDCDGGDPFFEPILDISPQLIWMCPMALSVGSAPGPAQTFSFIEICEIDDSRVPSMDECQANVLYGDTVSGTSTAQIIGMNDGPTSFTVTLGCRNQLLP